MATLGDELYERVNCYNVGPWLDTVFQRLGLAWPEATMPVDVPRTLPRSAGLTLTLYRVSDVPDLRDALIVYKVEADATAPMPRGLDAARYTLASARAKLSPHIEESKVSGDLRVSFFMPEGRVVELDFRSGLIGFSSCFIACLGTPSDWKTLPGP